MYLLSLLKEMFYLTFRWNY